MKDTPSLSIGREALVAVGSKALMAGIGFGGILIFANLLGDTGLGEYKTVMAAAFVLTQVPAGVSTAVKKRVSEVDIDPPEFLGTGLLVHAAFSVLVLLAFVVFQPWLVDYFGSTQLAYGVVAIVVTLGFFNVTNRLYSGIGYPALSSWMDTIRSVLTFALQLVGIWWGLESFGLVAGLAVATAITGVISAAAARVRPAVPTAETARHVYDFARWSVPNSLLTNLYASADILIIRAFVGAGAVGVYTVAQQLAMPAAMFAGSIRDALSVKSSGVDSAGGEVRADLENTMSYTGLLAIPLFFGALAIPKALLAIFGETFTGAPVLAVAGLALFQVFNVYRLPFEAVIEGTDRPGIIFRVNVGILVVHLPLAVGLGYTVGLLGVILSTILAEGVRVVAYQFVAHREYGGVVLTRPMGEQVLAGVVMYVAVEALTGSVVSITDWLWLLVVVGIGAAVYFLALLGISRHFRETLRHTLPMLEPREA